MYRSPFLPRGVFRRTWLNWKLDELMIGYATLTGNSSVLPCVGVKNNDTRGRRLAVMAILPFVTQSPQWVNYYYINRTGQTFQPNNASPFISDASPTAGQVYTFNPISFQNNTWAPGVIADGKRWLTLDGDPLMLVHPTFSFEIQATTFPNSVTQRPCLISCGFIWGFV